MLAKAPAPAVNHHLRPKRLEPEWTVALAPYNCRCLHLRQMRKWGISCSFSQSPTDNPAPAYDLMDDFVVLGPANNDPLNRNTTHRDNDRQPARTKKFAASFGRLKVHRVKSVVEKNSRMKQEVDEGDDELNVQDAPPFINSQSTLEVRGNKKNANAPSHGGRASSASRSEEFRNMRRKKGTADGIDRSGVNVKDAFEPLTDDQTKQHKPHRSDTMVSRQKASVSRGSSAKGWGNGGGSMYDLSELPDLKQRRKFSTDSDFFSRKSFRDLGCSDYMIECLRRQLFQRPSHIQAMAFAPVVEGKTSIIADQSGSGKTLAYLAPVIQRLREEELQGLSKPLSQSPRVVILVPTAELASQVLGICRSMSKFGVPVRSMVVTGGHRQKTQLENLQQDVDILIATPQVHLYPRAEIAAALPPQTGKMQGAFKAFSSHGNIVKNGVLRHIRLVNPLIQPVAFSRFESATPARIEEHGFESTRIADILKGKGKGADGSWLWCTTDETVYDAVKSMTQHNVGALVVVKPGEQKSIAGIITERDYLRKIIVQGRSSKSTKVGDIMTEENKLITVTPDTKVLRAMQLMTDNRIRHIPVIDDRGMIGMVSIGDVVRAVVSEHREELDRLNAYIQGGY